MINIKGAIFDLDGTLLDSMPVWEHVAVDYLKSVGIEPSDDVNETVRAMSIQQACELFCTEYGLTLTPEEITAGVNGLIEDFYFHRVTLKPGVRDMLESLQHQGVRMCVATATDRYLVEGALKRTGILSFFDRIITCTEAGAGKDKPDIFIQSLTFLGTSQDATVVFEDALYAIRTAKNAGFTVVALFDAAARPQESVIRQLADYYLDSFLKWDELNA